MLRNRAIRNKATGNQALKREIGTEGTSVGFASIGRFLNLPEESMEHEKRREVATAYYWICLHLHKGFY